MTRIPIIAGRALRRRSSLRFARGPLDLLLAGVFAGSSALASPASAEPDTAPPRPRQSASATFNPNLLEGGGKEPIDLSRFVHGNPVMPGAYSTDIYVNQTWLARRDVTIGADENHAATVCFDRNALVEMGIDFGTLPDLDDVTARLADGRCAELASIVPGAVTNFDSSTLRLTLSIPQLYMRKNPRGYVDPHVWDQGVSAGVFGYNANVYRSTANGQSGTRLYAGVNAGINIDGWRLRHQGSYTATSQAGSGSGSQYDALNTFVQHDVTGLQSQFTAGQSYTDGDLFDSVGFSGVKLASDDRMLPDSQRSYAPTIRGVAATNAKVTVKQGSNVLFETTVEPGPFKLDDLYNTGYAGDLTVVVTEADGSSHSFVVPYASIPQLLRPGTARFSVTVGALRDSVLEQSPLFAQLTYRRGLSNSLTVYGGVTGAEQYQAVLAGIALSTVVGAFSADVTQSWASGLPASAGGETTQSGQSYRLNYSRLVQWTQTSISLGAYRFSSSGYLNMRDAQQIREGWALSDRERSRFQLNVSQPIGETGGNVYISGYRSDYWSRSGSDITYSAGYSQSFRWGSMNVSASRSRAQNGEFDTQYYVSLSLPLGHGGNAPVLNTQVGSPGHGSFSTQVGVSGTAGEDRRLAYSAFGNYNTTQGSGTVDGGGNVSYATPVGTLSGSASVGDHFTQVSAGMSGAIVAHPGGVTLAQNLGEPMAVIEARGAEGATVSNNPGIMIDGRGYAVVSGLTPYQMTEVTLDPKGTGADVELQTTSQRVAARAGSVVFLKFPVIQGRGVMFKVTQALGRQPVPMGADVLDAQGRSVATVGQNGRIFMRPADGATAFIVQWGSRTDQRCSFKYDARPVEAGVQPRAFDLLDARCTQAYSSDLQAGAASPVTAPPVPPR
jgi:outer membrane usher protein